MATGVEGSGRGCFERGHLRFLSCMDSLRFSFSLMFCIVAGGLCAVELGCGGFCVASPSFVWLRQLNRPCNSLELSSVRTDDSIQAEQQK